MVERRIGNTPIPRIPGFYLTDQQNRGLSILNQFGWQLFCIRRPTFAEITTLLWNSHDQTMGVLTEDGILKLGDDLKIRSLRKASAALS
ncbi:MAG: hypothetical protein B6D72_11255 [gamma proteobacterium symbiont of Ctena orbiculata]|uniref:Uncharacterized protein n=1 Tax=Candidatus Thiodiazotropha taylori TaxID=2792791 RepID=A0A944MBK7_9GAMM|nr:hypothetical protein [Candidatus Thiodiazotropha taylori]PUB88973.1 MAG: hypothetical protein DBP00_03830 [gamma proteobacterium symbiont of Ctena orbiculata]MBT2988050.1 hypothetical protein [Candidatus Thiodiazotropha taylori]MBT2997687.1 hypothetical protein [Candidatus Thiodiazotropha taylori]MBT3001892.1 hypothetical protein [Candidatus Thiodiazotropha taylori]